MEQPNHQSLIRHLESRREHDFETDTLFAAATGYRNRFTGRLLSEALADPEVADEARRWEGPAGLTQSLDRTLATIQRLVSVRHPGWTWNAREIHGSHGPYCSFEITWPSTESQGRGHSMADAAGAALLRAIERDPEIVPGAIVRPPPNPDLEAVNGRLA